MQQSNIKQVSISGSAVNDYMPSGGKRRTRRTKVNARGGGNDDYNESPAHESAQKPNMNLNITKSNITQSVSATPPVTNNSSSTISSNQAQQQPPQLGGQKPKIIIAPKQKSRKVILAPKHHVIKPQLKANKKASTKRRLSLNITSVKNKIAKTRKHIHESQELSIDKIRKELIAAKLLNPASKAPDVLLRKIYADLKIIGHQ